MATHDVGPLVIRACGEQQGALRSPYRSPELVPLGTLAVRVQGGDDGDRYDLHRGYYSVA
jgi:hypothetical protein